MCNKGVIMTKKQKDDLKKFKKASKAVMVEDKKLLKELSKR